MCTAALTALRNAGCYLHQVDGPSMRDTLAMNDRTPVPEWTARREAATRMAFGRIGSIRARRKWPGSFSSAVRQLLGTGREPVQSQDSPDRRLRQQCPS